MKEEYEKVISHVNRIIDNLNQHWHSITLLLSHVSQPLIIDDRGLVNHLQSFKNDLWKILNELKGLDLYQTFSEIKFIGKRLTEIESTLKNIQENGLRKKIDLNFSCDGYELVKKPLIYDKKEPIEDPHENTIKLLNTLPQREGLALIHRLGLLGHKRQTTYVKLGEILGITNERASIVYKKALRKCRHEVRKELVKNTNNPFLIKEVFGES
jgi:hypothetical protein